MINHSFPPADDESTKKPQPRRLAWMVAGGILAIGLLAVLLLACILWIPDQLYPDLKESELKNIGDAGKIQELKGARLKLQNDARTTLLQGLGALLVLTGAVIA